MTRPFFFGRFNLLRQFCATRAVEALDATLEEQ
ncbi:Hypothetical Protein XCAW_02084 [Xanthomonas citri subsp. citri Aw12879]|nr:Hypothetical Protein XCAW_02084 [Xanthomonas citri subsp. citri Aw12879]